MTGLCMEGSGFEAAFLKHLLRRKLRCTVETRGKRAPELPDIIPAAKKVLWTAGENFDAALLEVLIPANRTSQLMKRIHSAGSQARARKEARSRRYTLFDPSLFRTLALTETDPF